MASGDHNANVTVKSSGVLCEVFRMTGRGTVGIFAELEGVVQVGDMAALPGGSAKVVGVEMIRFADPTKHAKDSIGLLLEGVEKEAILKLKGTRIVFLRGEG